METANRAATAHIRALSKWEKQNKLRMKAAVAIVMELLSRYDILFIKNISCTVKIVDTQVSWPVCFSSSLGFENIKYLS